MIKVKICGVKTKRVLEAALEGRADYIGFMFYSESPRVVSLEEAASLRRAIGGRAKNVAVVVNADDDFLDQVIAHTDPDFIQAHGEESPKRIAEIKQRTQRPIIKALAVSCAADIAQALSYDRADMILFDTKSQHRGGGGQAFDWRLLASAHLPAHWILAGGLNAHNLAQAVQMSGATCVDISSGVEARRGEKTPELVQNFLSKAKSL